MDCETGDCANTDRLAGHQRAHPITVIENREQKEREEAEEQAFNHPHVSSPKNEGAELPQRTDAKDSMLGSCYRRQ